MNRLLSISILLLLPILNSFGQINGYIPIPNDAKWLYTCTVTQVEPIIQSEVIQDLFELSGDTTIDSQSYNLLYRQRVGTSNIELLGAIRQDEQERKVYGYSFQTSSENLMYDFSLIPGDTNVCTESWFPPSHPAGLSEGGYGYDIVDSLSWILPQSSTNPGLESPTRLTYFRYQGWINHAVWAEGIGSLYYLGEPCSSDGEFTNCRLTSFCTGDTAWPPWIDNCNLVLGVNNNQKNTYDFQSYWDGTKLIVSSKEHINAISLFNTLGERIEYDTFIKSGADTWNVLKPCLSASGFYIVQIEVAKTTNSKLVYIRTP